MWSIWWVAAYTGHVYQGGPRDNMVEYNYYEKETCSKMTVQFKSAMNENTKIQIVSQDVVRTLLNTKEELGAKNRGEVVDRYAKKLLHRELVQEKKWSKTSEEAQI